MHLKNLLFIFLLVKFSCDVCESDVSCATKPQAFVICVKYGESSADLSKSLRQSTAFPLHMYVTEGFGLQVSGGLLVTLNYALDFHLLDPIQSCSQFKK